MSATRWRAMAPHLVPRFARSGWTSDGLRPGQFVEGWSFEVSWLGLHLELILAKHTGNLS